MAAPSNALRAGAAAAVLALAGALAYGLLSPSPSPDRHHTRVGRFDGSTAGVRCYYVTGRASPAALALFGLESDAGPRYARVRVCAEARDGGQAALPPGMDPVPGTESADEPLDDGGAPLEAWLGPAAPFDCACGVGCQESVDGGWRGWVAGGRNTLRAGTWRATDAGACVRRPCVELAGSPAEPEECR